MTTIKDIAKEVNLSIATVSRVLNYDDRLQVSDETRFKIIEAARNLGYVKRDRKNSKKITKVAVIQWYSSDSEMQDPFYLGIRIKVEEVLINHGIEVVRIFYQEDSLRRKLKGVAGIICIGKFSEKEIGDFRKLHRNLIFIDMFLTKTFVTNIVLDQKNATKDAIEYLMKFNHKKIGFIGGQEKLHDGSNYFERRNYFFKYYCSKYKIDYEKYYYVKDFTIDSGYEMAKKMIASKKMPTAIFCSSDQIAIGAMSALNEAGYKIPEDISIISFNNDNNSKFTNPPLTTFNAPNELMGYYAATQMITAIKNKEYYPISINIPCELIIRSSVCKAKN